MDKPFGEAGEGFLPESSLLHGAHTSEIQKGAASLGEEGPLVESFKNR